MAMTEEIKTHTTRYSLDLYALTSRYSSFSHTHTQPYAHILSLKTWAWNRQTMASLFFFRCDDRST